MKVGRLSLEGRVRALDVIFQKSRDKRDAHEKSREVLLDFAADPTTLTQIFQRHLRVASNLDSHHYPVLSIPIARTPSIELIANCWIPLPDRRTDLSTKAIHHHGEMLLSSVTVFGPGYEHWLLKAPPIESQKELYRLDLLERRIHGKGSVAFVDRRTAHVPFYPGSLSITIALWTSNRRTTWRDHLKRQPILQRNSLALRRAMNQLGLAKALDLKIVEYFDFTPTPLGFRVLRDRWEFPNGPNADYLVSLCSILQATRNEDLVTSSVLPALGTIDPRLSASISSDLASGKAIEAKLSPGHTGVEHANFTSADIEAAVRAGEGLQ